MELSEFKEELLEEIQDLISKNQDKGEDNEEKEEKSKGIAYFEHYKPIDNVKKDFIFGLAIFKFVGSEAETKKIKVRINESAYYLESDEIQFLFENIKPILNQTNLHKDKTFRRYHVSYKNNYFQVSAKLNTKFLIRTISIKNEKVPLSEKEVNVLCSVLQKSLTALES